MHYVGVKERIMKKVKVTIFVFITFITTLNAQWLETTITVGTGPDDLCWNATNNKVYCANSESNDVTIVDGATNTIITSIGVGVNPCSFCWNSIQNRMYVANINSSTVSVIADSTTGIDEVVLHNTQRSGVSIIPNPSKALFTLHSKSTLQNIEIYNSIGTRIKAEWFNESKNVIQVFMHNVNSGVYFIKIRTDSDELVEKLIITR
jgi:YVTN family beta-propeller protein